MKRHYNRILSFILSVSILITAFLCFPVSVYATHGGGGGSNHGSLTEEEKKQRKQEILDNSEKYLLFLCSQLSTHVNGGGYKDFFENYVEYTKSMGLDLYLDDNISIQDNGDIDFSEDLVSAIKQSLIEYNEETNGLYLAPTVNVHDIPIEFFSSSTRYHSLVDIVDSLGLAGVASNGDVIADLSIIHENGYSFVANVTSDTEQDLINSPLYCRGFYSNSTWGGPYGLAGGSADTDRWDYGSVRRFSNIANERLTWEDGVYPLTMYNPSYQTTGSLIFGYSNGKSLTNLGHYNPTSWSGYNAQYAVWSSDGRRVRVWKNETAFIYGTENQRTVYFGKDFYSSAPSQITVSVDDLNNSIEKLDTVLDKLLEKIDGNTEESEIEDILQSILDEIRGSGGGSGTGTGSGSGSGGGSSLPEGWCDDILIYLDRILEQLKSIKSDSVSGGGNTVAGGSAPEHWYDDILSYLDRILDQLKSIKRWTAIDTVIDGVDAIADWFDLIHDILSDVDDGMESAVSTLSSALDDAAGLLKTKFPFSVPWDIFFFVTLLAAEPEVPRFEVPIDFGVSAIDMHVHYDFVVDFTDYQYLSDIFRVILSMTYAVGLLKMTAGIVSTRKEE